jgi:DNA-binding MarR family transcriptional regulator
MKNPRLSKGYGLVSSNILRDPDISLREKGLYAYLATYADSKGEITASINRMANECGITQSTVKRTLEELKTKGIIARESRGIGTSFKTILLK